MMNVRKKFHPHIGVENPQYHQVSLIYSILLIMVVYFGLIGTLNITLFDAPQIALYDYIGLVLASIILIYVSRGGNIHIACWVVTCALVFVLMAFMHIAKGNNYSLIWLSILPPIAFFLLGPRTGFIFTAAVFAYSGWYLYGNLSAGTVSTTMSLGALFNFIEVATAQLFIFRFYERSRRQAYAQMQKIAITDPLTKVFNRLYLDNAIQSLLAGSARTLQPVSVLLLDVDYFKRINDQYGHLKGDDVLVNVAKTITDNVRAADIVGRWGGEEFLILCPNTTTDEAAQLAERVRQAVGAMGVENELAVTVSIGVATAQQFNDETGDRLLSVADNNMYLAKQAGRNQLVASLTN
ncbi:GGDEF domain-containing protein [Pseudidiomarina donghaiensis]|uniref:diguanylate cyclase n=1 Tax=Pseudidiomarina donghaiensis TaxID=519452 RepID=A0A432XID8_9GAMM|nr:GGDEF domain-containing protein [Pseudidiomarina donghaiensis]RUO48471.1 GGDEF domain-containing protein [Pseudidiomarina donghaiensis]SFV23823.1 diguanylate cyclase (GGDEF) domain-containing protein [Pseudidiomarina donghaiensis]